MPLLSMPRFVVVLFPCWIALALLLDTRRRFAGVIVVFAGFYVVLLALFSVMVFVA